MSTLYVNNIEPVSGSSLTLISASLVSVDNLSVASLTSSFQGDLTGTASFAVTASHALNSTSAAGTEGQVQFNSGSEFGADSNLFWDNTNKRLGVGTDAPTQALDVNGSAIFSSSVTSLSSFKSHILQANNGDGNGRVALQTWDNMIVNVEDGGVGIAKGVYLTPSAQVHIKGSGSTSATTSLLVQNSSGSEIIKADDSGVINIGYNFTGGAVRLPGFTVGSNLFYPFSGGSIGRNDNVNYHISNIYSKGVTHITDNTTSSTTLEASAKLQADSTTQGFLPPRMTTTQKEAISSPASGLMVYDTDLNQMSYYNGTSWVNF